MSLPNESPVDTNELNSDPADQATDPAGETAALRDALAAAEAKSLENRDLYMRALAEMENLRKRAARDVEQAHKYALDKFAQDLINVKDSLELGLQAAQAANAESLITGTDATLQLLNKAFERANIVAVEPKDQPFNPELHEAMATQEAAGVPANTVMQVIQKGYQLNGRLLRPARVIVAR